MIMERISKKIYVLIDMVIVWPVLILRFLKFGYSYRRIPLGENEYAIVDPLVYYRLKNFHWYLDGNGNGFYAYRNIIIGPGKTKIISMHRELMGFPKGLLVDHHNSVTLDNRMSNLRLATHSENACNRTKIRTKTSSQYIGVCFHKSQKRWITQIRLNGKKTWLGTFNNEIDAAKAYDEAAKKYHGEFARLNNV